VSLRLTAEPEALVLVRRVVAGLARDAGFDQERCDDVRVAVNEACTNVVVHAYSDGMGLMDVEAAVNDSHMVVTVRDHGAGIVPDAESTSPGLGLGLQMMAALADDVRVSASEEGGTEVRLRFDRAA
jgi:serine/threonine-protein kinase RsbW